ncbi:MAG: hypothetical protein NC416_03305 [Eubacterium sp.]|nr:hypothetical protein [Eubacterium sp.]
MHFLFKIKGTVLAIISYFVRLYIRLLKDRTYLGLADCGKTGVSRSFCKLIDMFCQKCARPCFSGIAEVNRLLVLS